MEFASAMKFCLWTVLFVAFAVSNGCNKADTSMIDISEAEKYQTSDEDYKNNPQPGAD